jgi:hypothetical protein
MTHETHDNHQSHQRAGRHDDRIPLDPNQPVSLTVHNPNGDVVVRGADRGDALIRALKRGRPGSPRYDAAELVVQVDDNHIVVRSHIPGILDWAGFGPNLDLGNVNPFKRGIAWAEANAGTVFAEAGQALADAGKAVARSFHDDVGYDLEIELPRSAPDLQVAVHTASGDISVAAIFGPVTLNSASGDIHTRDTGGELNAHTASGDLFLERVTGRLTARTVSGDARVAAARLDAIDLHSVSGDLLLQATLRGDAPSHLQSVSGDVRLRLSSEQDAAPNVTLTLKSVSGDATVAPPFRKIDRRTWQLGSGATGPRLSVQTVSGDLDAGFELLPSSPAPSSPPQETAPPPPPSPAPTMPRSTPPPSPVAPPPPPLPPAQPAPSGPSPTSDPLPAAPAASPPVDAARLTVLQAVERGEIDVEEALRRLDPDADQEPESGPATG